MRDYTPRRYDEASGELDIDFVLHGEGPAATWAAQAEPGQFLHIAGPRGSMVVPDMFDSYLLIGDETAIPSIARRLESLPANRAALVVVEVANQQEQQTFESAAQVDVIWIVRSEQSLVDVVRRLEMPEGKLYAWVATESGLSRKVRRVLLDEFRHDRAAHTLRRDAHLSIPTSNSAIRTNPNSTPNALISALPKPIVPTSIKGYM
jgi:NADPH-dependent ferric siderophore reductase